MDTLPDPAQVLAELELLSFSKIRATLSSLEDGDLDPFLGPTLHAAFGSALREVSCTTKREFCAGCLVLERCAYPALAEAQTLNTPGSAARENLPQALILTPPNPRRAPWIAGDRLNIEAVVVGPAAAHIPYVVAAMPCLGSTGLGTDRLKFELDRVDAFGPSMKWESVWPNSEGDRPLGPTPELTVKDLPRLPIGERVAVHFDTPVCLMTQGVVNTAPTFEILVRALLRRCFAFLNLSSEGQKRRAFDDLVTVSKEVRTVESTVQVVSFSRWSSSQQRRHPLDGLVGHLTFEGDTLPIFEPLLRLGQALKVGKGTSFGLGRFRVE